MAKAAAAIKPVIDKASKLAARKDRVARAYAKVGDKYTEKAFERFTNGELDGLIAGTHKPKVCSEGCLHAVEVE